MSGDESEGTNYSSEEENMDMEQNQQQNPSVVALATVQEMFGEIKREMEQLKLTVQRLEERKIEPVKQEVVQECATRVLKKVNDEWEADQRQVIKLKEDLKHFKYRNRTLTKCGL